MNVTHTLKTWPKYFKAIKEGKKLFEIRYNDRDYSAGDMLILREFDPKSKTFTGNIVMAEVLSVWSGLPGVENKYCIMDIRKVQ